MLINRGKNNYVFKINSKLFKTNRFVKNCKYEINKDKNHRITMIADQTVIKNCYQMPVRKNTPNSIMNKLNNHTMKLIKSKPTRTSLTQMRIFHRICLYAATIKIIHSRICSYATTKQTLEFNNSY
jgi:hypothetical protein